MSCPQFLLRIYILNNRSSDALELGLKIVNVNTDLIIKGPTQDICSPYTALEMLLDFLEGDQKMVFRNSLMSYLASVEANSRLRISSNVETHILN
jgi:hypothetical protein